jgi:hypothetical protein
MLAPDFNLTAIDIALEVENMGLGPPVAALESWADALGGY